MERASSALDRRRKQYLKQLSCEVLDNGRQQALRSIDRVIRYDVGFAISAVFRED